MPGDRLIDDEVDTQRWLDSDAGPMVRPFAVTGGRARSACAEFDLLSYVVTNGTAPEPRRMQPEHRAILARATAPVSLAELASHVDLPVGVVRVLLGDLIEMAAVTVQEPTSHPDMTDDNLLKAVIHALRTL
jgi:hypothetical protein